MRVYDVIVVGSGASGGWVAKELTEKGIEVLMLEAGPPRVPGRDFTEHAWPYQLRYRGFGNQKRLIENQPIQRLCYACDDYSRQFFVNDHECPYTFPPDKPFFWIRGRQIGGRTYCWARVSYRFSDFEFKAASRDGYGLDWPISYKDIEPYYDRVESFIGVSGTYEKLPQFPDGKFLPPMNLSCGELWAKPILEQKFGWRLMPDRTANLTAPLEWPAGVPLLRPMPARLLHRLLFQQPFGDAARGGPYGQAHPHQRRRGQPPFDERRRQGGRRRLHRPHERERPARRAPRWSCWRPARSNRRVFF